MKLFLLFTLLLAASGACWAQAPTLPQQYRAAIVSIKAGGAAEAGEAGSGFVVGSTPDSVYIVTAGHVIQPAGTAALAKLEGLPQYLPAKVLYFAYEPPEDLALLAVAAKNFRWPRYSYYTGLTPNDSLCFIRSTLTQATEQTFLTEKLLLPLNSEAYMLSTDGEQHTLSFVLEGVQPGDSGSALLLAGSTLCVVGMITKSATPHTAISIEHVKDKLLPKLGRKWQLAEKNP